MSDERELPPEHGIVSGRMSGALSVDASFESLYKIYAPRGCRLAGGPCGIEHGRGPGTGWTVFYRRWRTWQQPPEMNTPAARPVLSFLFRTVHLTAKAHHRGKLVHEPIAEHDPPDHAAPQRLYEMLTLGRCLELARRHCCPEDIQILTGKLAGVPAKEIARALSISEPAVDHRYRNALENLRQQVQSGPGKIQ